MSDRERPSIAVLVVEVLRPMIVAAMVVSLPYACAWTLYGVVSTPTLHAPIGAACGAYAVWRVVRRFNRAGDPKHSKLPPSAS